MHRSIAVFLTPDFAGEANVGPWSVGARQFGHFHCNGDCPKHRSLTTPDDEPGRNDLCPCGSGRKFKHCCGVSA